MSAQPLEEWLKLNQPLLVAQIVKQVDEELPTYQQISLAEKLELTNTFYPIWYHSILTDDITTQINHLMPIVAQRLRQDFTLDDLFRVLWIYKEVIIGNLENSPNVTESERREFAEKAAELTEKIIRIARLQMVNHQIKRITNNLKKSPD